MHDREKRAANPRRGVPRAFQPSGSGRMSPGCTTPRAWLSSAPARHASSGKCVELDSWHKERSVSFLVASWKVLSSTMPCPGPSRTADRAAAAAALTSCLPCKCRSTSQHLVFSVRPNLGQAAPRFPLPLRCSTSMNMSIAARQLEQVASRCPCRTRSGLKCRAHSEMLLDVVAGGRHAVLQPCWGDQGPAASRALDRNRALPSSAGSSAPAVVGRPPLLSPDTAGVDCKIHFQLRIATLRHTTEVSDAVGRG